MIRVIPRLDIKGPNLVKGIHLEGLRVLGPPEEFSRRYYDAGADELLYVDAVASLYGRNSLLEIVERTARTIFIPLTVGGGIRTLEDIQRVLRVGADKVALNTAALERPELIREAATKFGSSTVTISIDAKKTREGAYVAYTGNGRDNSGRDVVAWACECAALGAGEILLTSIDRDGTGEGYDLELTESVATAVDIPVIACGGAGSAEHVAEAVLRGKADAVSAGSILHYPIAKELADSGADLGRAANSGSSRKRSATTGSPGPRYPASRPRWPTRVSRAGHTRMRPPHKHERRAGQIA